MEGTYCRALAGTTMHLIINSLDTRRWMSDGGFAGGWWVAGQGVQGGGRGGVVGLLQGRRGEGGKVGWIEEEGEGERRMVVWRKVGGADEGKG